MKKGIFTFTLFFILSMATTSFAAMPGFNDVPAKHWAYDAVSQLAKAGIIEGYGDKTFRGDNAITRYEMAVLTAKAIQKYEKANAKNKALIDKLSVEFASELNTLGARVAQLEKDMAKVKASSVDKIKFSGSTKTEWVTERDEVKNKRATKFKTEIKLNTLVQADERTKVMAGINYENKGDDTARKEGTEIEFENLWVETKLDDSLSARFGSQSLALGRGLFLDADSILGAKLSWKADKHNSFEFFAGRDTQTDVDTDYETPSDTPNRKLSYLNWTYSFNGGELGTYIARQEKYKNNAALPQDKFWSVYGSYDLSPVMTVGYEYVKNTTTCIAGHVAELTVGKAKKPGEWKHTFTYLNGPQGLFADEEYTNYDDQYTKYGYKGFGYLAAVRLTKASVLSFERYWGATYDGKNKGQQFSELKLAVKF